MEIVFAAIIWNAQAISYVPMSRQQCEVVRQSNWHTTKPLVECMAAKWTCERGFRLIEPIVN
jgi:hypothetical protein